MESADFDRRLTNYLHWYGPATFLRCPLQPDFADTDIGLIGVPYSGGNHIERMQYLGPRAVRDRSAGYHRVHREFGIDPFALARVRDLGDAPIGRTLNPDMAAEDFQGYFEQVFRAGITPVSVGGDHSITWPILRAARATRFPAPLGMIHFDSHTDASPPMTATRHHAAGFRMGAEDGLIDPRRTVQIGIRGPMASLAQDDWAKEHFARVITTEEVVTRGVEQVRQEIRRVIGDGPAYVSFDVDAIDPAYAPGVADPEVDGLTVREVRQMLLGLRGMPLMGADFVCYCPPLDNPAQITALTISQLMLDTVTLIAEYQHAARNV